MPNDPWAQFAQPTAPTGGADKWAAFAQSPAPAPAYQPYTGPVGGSISPAPAPSILDRLRGTVANSAVGYSLEQALPKLADALGLHPTETVNSPTYQSDRQNFVAPQYLVPGNPQTQQGQKVKALLTGMGNITNPKVLATGAGIGAAAGLAAPLAPVLIPAALAATGVGIGGVGALYHATQAQAQYNQGNVDAGDAATSNIPTDLLMLLGGASQGLPSEGTVPGENFTPTQQAAHTGILGRMNGLGDNFIPQQASADTLSTIRQAAADNPAIAAAATGKGSTPQNIAAFQAILQKANTALETPHAATLAQYAGTPADVSSVQAAVGSTLPKTLTGVAPEDAAAIQELQQRLGTVNTLGGLNDLRQWLNNEAAAGYKQDGVAAARGTATKAGIRSAADAARNAYYDQLQQASGTDFQPIKAQQSALLDQQEGTAKLGQTLSAQQAIADEPKSPQQVISDALTGGRTIKSGPLSGVTQLIAEKVLGRTPLTQPNYLIRKTLGNLPSPSAPPAAAPPPIPIPAAPQVGGSPNPVLQPGGGIVLSPQSPPIPTTSTLDPQAVGLGAGNPTAQLPSGSISRLLTDSASPDNPQTPYPQLNANAARTVVQPNPANPKLGPLGRALTVGPDGTVHIEPAGNLSAPKPRVKGGKK